MNWFCLFLALGLTACNEVVTVTVSPSPEPSPLPVASPSPSPSPLPSKSASPSPSPVLSPSPSASPSLAQTSYGPRPVGVYTPDCVEKDTTLPGPTSLPMKLIPAGTYKPTDPQFDGGTLSGKCYVAAVKGSVILDAAGTTLKQITLTNAALKGVVIKDIVSGVQDAAVKLLGNARLIDSTVQDSQGEGISFSGTGNAIIRVTALRNGQEGISGKGTNVVITDSVFDSNNNGKMNPPWKTHAKAVLVDLKDGFTVGSSGGNHRPNCNDPAQKTATNCKAPLWYVDPGFEAGMGKIAACTNCLFQYNLVQNNYGIGFWLDVSDNAFTVQNNELHSQVPTYYSWEGSNLALELTNGPILVQNNYSHDSSADGIAIWETHHVKLLNNVVLKNKWPGLSFRCGAHGTFEPDSITISGNRFNGAQPVPCAAATNVTFGVNQWNQ